MYKTKKLNNGLTIIAVLSIGDELDVKVTEIDEKGRINLSRKVLL